MTEADTTKLDPENHLHLDQALVRLPFELLRKNFKSAQRHVEKDRDFILEAIQSTATKAAGTQSAEETLNAVDKILARAQNLHRKLENLKSEESRMHEHGTRRLQHLQALYQAPSLSSSQYTDWSKVRLQRMLVDYLVRQGRPDTARFLAKKKNIEPLVDLDLFNRCQAIRASLLRRSTTECLTWCHENKLGARKKEIDLEFELRLQQYIELARTRDRLKLLEARQHAQTHLFPHSAEQPWRLHSAAGLLAFPPNTTCEPARGLYAPARWEFLADLFERTHHALYAVPAAPALRLALTAGLSAVKTPMCHAVRTGSGGGGSAGGSGGREPSAHSGMGSNDVCPVCSAELNGLARDVPYANHTTSKNMETESVFLPNGRVYGLERLLAIGRKFGVAEGRVRDPTTGEIFDLAEMRTVFIS